MFDGTSAQSNIQSGRISEVVLDAYFIIFYHAYFRLYMLDWFNVCLYHCASRWISCKEINPESIVGAKKNAIETVCLVEEHFPTSVLTIQVHLLLHLVDEVEIVGTVHS